MPIIHTINPQEKLVISLWLGHITSEEAYRSYDELYGRADWQPGFSELVDLREADMSEITSDVLAAISRRLDAALTTAGATMKTGVVAPHDLEFGMARIYEALASETPEQFRVFRNFEDAVTWLE